MKETLSERTSCEKDFFRKGFLVNGTLCERDFLLKVLYVKETSCQRDYMKRTSCHRDFMRKRLLAQSTLCEWDFLPKGLCEKDFLPRRLYAKETSCSRYFMWKVLLTKTTFIIDYMPVPQFHLYPQFISEIFASLPPKPLELRGRNGCPHSGRQFRCTWHPYGRLVAGYWIHWSEKVSLITSCPVGSWILSFLVFSNNGSTSPNSLFWKSKCLTSNIIINNPSF